MVQAVYGLCYDASGGGLAAATRAAEQVGMGYAVLPDRLPKSGGHVFLPHQLVKAGGAPFAVVDLGGHS